MIDCYIFILLFIGVMFYLGFNFAHNHDNSSILPTDICNGIDKLNTIKERLTTIDSLITDIEICKPNKLEKPITISWFNASGDKKTYDLWVDGSNANTDYLLAIANTEHKALCNALIHNIKNMQYRCNANDNADDNIISGRGDKK